MLELLEGGPKPEQDRDEDVAMRRRPADGNDDEDLVCVACTHRVTSTRARMEVAGHHRHVCTNPKGIPFDIGCFMLAPGCAPRGPFESYWTWFPGFEWQIVVCASCQAHLGWAFSSADETRFFGLILARIASAKRDADE